MLVKVSPEVFSLFAQIVNDLGKTYLTATDKQGNKMAYDTSWSTSHKAYVIESEFYFPSYFINEDYLNDLGYRLYDPKLETPLSIQSSKTDNAKIEDNSNDSSDSEITESKDSNET